MSLFSSRKSPAQIAVARLYNECVALATRTQARQQKILKDDDNLMRDNRSYSLLIEFLQKFTWNNQQITKDLQIFNRRIEENNNYKTTDEQRRLNLVQMTRLWNYSEPLIVKALKSKKALTDFNEKLDKWLQAKRNPVSFFRKTSPGFYAGVY